MGDKQGHPFRGNQYGTPSGGEGEDRGKFYYHATPTKNLDSIAATGLVPPKGSQNPVSFAPNLEAARTWEGLVGGQDNALLRVPRGKVRGIETSMDEGEEYDDGDESSEVGTYRPVKPEGLEVFHEGRWKNLREHAGRGPGGGDPDSVKRTVEAALAEIARRRKR
jgi:hypothetical protein